MGHSCRSETGNAVANAASVASVKLPRWKNSHSVSHQPSLPEMMQTRGRLDAEAISLLTTLIVALKDGGRYSELGDDSR